MATISLRSALLRSLPALLLLLTLGFAAPQPVTGPILAGVSHSASAASPAGPESTSDTPAAGPSSVTPLPRTPEEPVADHTRDLSAQRTAGVSGSRAPPAPLA